MSASARCISIMAARSTGRSCASGGQWDMTKFDTSYAASTKKTTAGPSDFLTISASLRSNIREWKSKSPPDPVSSHLLVT